jgi:cytochrome oxidase Cu insertion factor (SCO1/SenC/PrrC family)
MLVGIAIGFAVSYVGKRVVGAPASNVNAPSQVRFAARNLGSAPSLSGFTDQLGRPFNPASLKGKVVVTSFLDPLSTRVSPVIAVNLLMALKSDLEDSGQFGKQVVFLSIDVDPQASGPTDTAAFMKRVVGFGKTPAPVEDWPFLTAPPQRVSLVVRDGFRVPYQRLAGKALAAYEANREAQGTYFHAQAWNPLAKPDEPTVVDNGEVVIIGPNGTIRARVPRAYQVSHVTLMNIVESVLGHGPT